MYVEAKEKRPGDHPVEVLPGQESEVEETPIAAPARQQVENWQLWLALFYDIKSP